MTDPPGQHRTEDSPPPRRVRQYEILEELARGGMGVVYRARDTRLRREVALKRSLPEFTDESARRRRFLREGRAAARLSHPNIVTVLEAFEEDGVPWLAMQYVDGRSLRDVLRRDGKLPPMRVARYGKELASALATAHAADVLHRDINPNNVLVGPDDRAMLTDFGLARLVEPAGEKTRTFSVTTPGEVIGTPQYMSPEQALGRSVDARSDIFSLGAVLFEMCTGTYAFVARTVQDLFQAIMNRDPDFGNAAGEIPDELQRIVRRCLAKSPEERYQRADELAAELRSVERRLEYRTLSESKTARRATIWRVLVAVGVVALAVVALKLVSERPRARFATRPIQVTKSRAVESSPDLSPDGRLIAFTSDESGNLDIYVIAVDGGMPLRLTDDEASDFDPVWFPDGNEIAFVSDRRGRSSIWKTSQFGGGATMLVPDAMDPDVSPDGSRIAFVRAGETGDLRIAVAPLHDPAAATFLTRDGDGLWGHRDPAWSPDGETICYWAQQNLWLVPAAGGAARPLTREAALDMEPAWSSDGREVYFSSYRGGTLALWRVSAQGGEPVRVTLGTGPESHPSVARNGRRLAYATNRGRNDLALLDLHTGEEEVVPGFADDWMPTIAPDGSQVVFVSDRWGERLDLWVLPLSDHQPAGPPRRLTDHPGDASHPVYSRDGRFIAYYRIVGQERDIWILSTADLTVSRFTDDPAPDIQPAWSPDGSKLAFSSERDGRAGIWVADVVDGRRGGDAHRVSARDVSAFAPSWSPDGSTIAFIGTKGNDLEVWLTGADGEGQTRELTQGAEAGRVRWDAATGGLLVTGSWGEERVTLRRVDPAGVEPTGDPLFDLGEQGVYPMFDVTPDGGSVVVFRQQVSGDIWVHESDRSVF